MHVQGCKEKIEKKTQLVFLLLKLKELLLELNTLTFLSDLYNTFLTMVHLFQNMISIHGMGIKLKTTQPRIV